MHTVHQCGDMTEHGCSSLSEGQSCQRAPHVCDLLISVWEGWKETLSPAGGGRLCSHGAGLLAEQEGWLWEALLRRHWNPIMRQSFPFLWPLHLPTLSLLLPPSLSLFLLPSSLSLSPPPLPHQVHMTSGFPWPPPKATHPISMAMPPNHISKLHSHRSSCGPWLARGGHQSPAAPSTAVLVAGQPWSCPGWQGLAGREEEVSVTLCNSLGPTQTVSGFGRAGRGRGW